MKSARMTTPLYSINITNPDQCLNLLLLFGIKFEKLNGGKSVPFGGISAYLSDSIDMNEMASGQPLYVINKQNMNITEYLRI